MKSKEIEFAQMFLEVLQYPFVSKNLLDILSAAIKEFVKEEDYESAAKCKSLVTYINKEFLK